MAWGHESLETRYNVSQQNVSKNSCIFILLESLYPYDRYRWKDKNGHTLVYFGGDLGTNKNIGLQSIISEDAN